MQYLCFMVEIGTRSAETDCFEIPNYNYLFDNYIFTI